MRNVAGTVLWTIMLVLLPLLSGCTLEVQINSADEVVFPSLDTTINTSKLSRNQYPSIKRALNTATTLLNKKILVAGGAYDASPISATTALTSVEIYDPETGVWSQAENLPQARLGHTATLLQDGKVLLIGGTTANDSSACLNTTALYDPTSGTWSTAASLTTGRCYHTATLLKDGRVIVMGGRTTNTNVLTTSNYSNSVEIYNPATNVWTSATAMSAARAYHSAVLLKNGKILIVGGRNTATLLTTALYNPSSNSWAAGQSLTKSRKDHTATLLPDGKVVIIGGVDGATELTDTTIFDPTMGVNGAFSAGASLSVARKSHTATLVGDKIFVVGGGTATTAYKDTLMYNPSTNQWSPLDDMEIGPRIFHTANIAGKYLVVLGGIPSPSNTASVHATPEKLDLSAYVWKSEASMSVDRFIPAAALLKNGKVLIAGGLSTTPTFVFQASSEIFDPSTNTWSAAAPLPAARVRSTATVLASGKVLVVGGQDATGTFNSSVIYDSDSDTWSSGPSMSHYRSAHTATLLPNGKVLIIGGTGDMGGTSLPAPAEIYDPTTNSWSLTPNMPTPCYFHTATLVPDSTGGKVFVIGGSSTTFLASMQVYDIASNSWSVAPPLTEARSGHTVTHLNGKLIVAGGYSPSGALSTVEIYDIASNTWSAGASLLVARNAAGAVALASGKVLVIGGQSTAGAGLVSSEIYDPATNTWTMDQRALNEGRAMSPMFTLNDGRLLLVGGADPANAMATVESYSLSPIASPEWKAPSLLPGRSYHTATLLNDGRVFVAGGVEGANPATSTRIYTPSSNTWTPGPNLSTFRGYHTATLLTSGKVFIAGGMNATNDAIQTADVYDPDTNSITTINMVLPRMLHSAIPLPGGKVLVSGGINNITSITTKNEICDPALGTCTASSDRPNGSYDLAVALKTGEYLFVGPFGVNLYQPLTDTWTAAASMTSLRVYHTAITLASGKVLALGGVDGSTGTPTTTTEIYDPTTNSWSAGPTLDTALLFPVANLLPSGEVVLTGGLVGISTTSDQNVRVYDPVENQWTFAQPLKEARSHHTATVLKNGHLMVYGGENSTFGSLPFWEQVFEP
ncbi:Kelch repeat-containing protein [Bdellovibrio sp. HCB117]|uniref:Kelch repeat-containing protein n=1 Tax=Bdellovibrio sp. HCB117 TaxID=3394359 RepID=UPI0039B5DC58